MTFYDNESGVETSRPREGIEFILPAVTYRVATGMRDVVINSTTFSAYPVARQEIAAAVVGTGSEEEVTVLLPLTHPVSVRWLAGGIPPQRVLVNIWRKQTGAGGGEEIIWRGLVGTMATDGRLAKFQVLSRLNEAMYRRIPVITAGRACGHILYDANCKVNKTFATETRIVIAHSGRTVTFNGISGGNGFFKYGEFTHVPSGEKMTITDHTGNVVTLQFPIYGLKNGDTITLSPGCDHTPTDCYVKYSNILNYGGQPDLPNKNPMLPTGFGISVQV